jgi:hypothetical protein
MVPTTLHWGVDRDKELALDLLNFNKLEFLVFCFGIQTGEEDVFFNAVCNLS